MPLSNQLAPLSGTAGFRARLGWRRARAGLAWAGAGLREPTLLTRVCDRSTLPPDVIDDEVTEVICFKASLALNRLLGGDADMTFSARAFRASTGRGWAAKRCAWALVRIFVDLSCAILRGESRHCETAWTNHCRRPGAARRG